MKRILSLVLISLVVSHSYILQAKVYNYDEREIDENFQSSLSSDSTTVDVLISKILEFRFSEPELARNYADTALEVSKQLNLKAREAEILNQLGIIASVLGDSPTALEYFLDVLTVREEIGDLPGISRIQNNLGILYKNLGDFDRSLQFHSESLSSKRLLNDSLGIARSLNNIGEIYQQQKNTIRAKQNFEESLELMILLNYKEGLAAVFNNLGEVHKLDGDINSAIKYHEQSLEIEKEHGNISGIGYSYMNIASLFLKVDQPEVAIINYKEAISNFNKINDLSGLERAYNDLATTYSELERFQESLYYFQLQSSLKDSLVSVQTNKQIAELQTQYESEKQKQEILLLNERSLMQEAQINQQAKIRNLLILITVLLFGLAFVLYRSNKSRKNANALLTEKNRKIEEAAELKSQFLSVLSHEIRTPMNAVVGMTNLLVHENPRQDQKKYLDTLLYSSNNLLSIVNDVLDYSKAEAGKITLESIDFRLLFLLSNLHQSFYNQSVKKEVYLKIEHDDKIPDVLKGDPTRLTQILSNLISNALKFTEKGSIIVQVSLEDQSEESVEVSFKVIDTGIGIAIDKQDSIFESFIQADKDIHRKYGGTGLGLPITKNLIELFGSNIKLVSTEGKGSTFSFSIVFEKGDLKFPINSPQADINSFEKIGNIKVLVVEDNPVNIQVIKLFLKKWGIDPVIALNGNYAVEYVKEEDFDIILMDLHMPIMDGYKATEIIRELEKNSVKKTPIIALTASNIFEEHTHAYESGVNEIVPKPFEPYQLHQTILKYIKKDSAKLN